MIFQRKLAALLLLTVATPPPGEPSASVKVMVPSGPHYVKEAVSVTVRNETGKTVWYCVEVSKTTLHDPAAETGTPVPVFRIKSRKTENEKWGYVAWGRDYGGLALPEKLPAGEGQRYSIFLLDAGYNQLEMVFRHEQVSAEECNQELKGAKRSRSRVFRVLARKRSGGAVPTIDTKDGSLHLTIPVVATTKPKQ